MKERMHSHAYLPHEMENGHLTFFINFSISIICHLIFFVILIFSPGYATDRRPPISVINVSLVTLPAREEAPLQGEQRIVDPERYAPKTVSEKSQKPSTAVSVKPKKRKVKQSLKKKTFKFSRVVKSAITRIEKKVEESRPAQVTQAIDRLRHQVKKIEAGGQKKGGSVKGQGIPGGSAADSKKILELIDIYRVEIAYQVQKNWAFSEQLAGARTNLVAELAFTVMPNGEIREIWFDKRSGNRYLDESAQKAIMKTNPVRPHPPGVKKPFVNVGLRFTPKGVK